MRIDFISDVVCPWCVIGLRALEQAMAEVQDVVRPDLVLHPFELNPDMPAGGQNVVEHVAQKYGASPEHAAAGREAMRARAAEVGFRMETTAESRIYNTFDAHRLLAWARDEGRQLPLKHALFDLHFTQGRSPDDRDALVDAAEAAGLDGARARAVLEGGAYVIAVRREERHWREEGVSAVPTMVIDGQYVIAGAQTPQALERALRHIAGLAAAAA